MIRETDIANLLMGMFSLVIFVVKKKDFPRYNLFFYAYYSIMGALVFNVVKYFYLEDLFTVSEHLCYALAGVFFASGSYIYFARRRPDGEPGP